VRLYQTNGTAVLAGIALLGDDAVKFGLWSVARRGAFVAVIEGTLDADGIRLRTPQIGGSRIRAGRPHRLVRATSA
jgi:hypothetical protein